MLHLRHSPWAAVLYNATVCFPTAPIQSWHCASFDCIMLLFSLFSCPPSLYPSGLIILPNPSPTWLDQDTGHRYLGTNFTSPLRYFLVPVSGILDTASWQGHSSPNHPSPTRTILFRDNQFPEPTIRLARQFACPTRTSQAQIVLMHVQVRVPIAKSRAQPSCSHA